ncbi:MAG: hypothetical protein Q4C58_02210 [Eubacteriales bacterium]|nr:hypothetical protein [Eubacteriales bacterium]
MLKKTIRKKGALLAALVAMMLLAGCGNSLERQDGISETDYEESQSDNQEAEYTEAAITDDVSNDTETAAMTEEESKEAVESGTTFTLTEKGKAFLAKLCNEMDDFNADSTLDEKFWRDFLFNSYTGALSEDVETEQVYREDLGFEETVVKVSLQEAESYVKLVFGTELPDLKPAFEDMEKGQTAFYYKDGSYYIGVSSLPDYQYTYSESLPDNKNNANMIIKYTIDFMGESNVGTVTFTISLEDNENGFVVQSKNTEFVK